MLCKKLAALTLVATLPGLAGCMQAIRHSNTMVFATTTSLGIKAGASAGETPAINVGYDRQEAVLMPLLANTKEKPESANKLTPCGIDQVGLELGEAAELLHPCKFVATETTTTSLAGGERTVTYQDSYSVLASFGARGGGGTGSGAAEGTISLAQYFATGLAAQKLAENGGASVVSTGVEAKDGKENEDKP